MKALGDRVELFDERVTASPDRDRAIEIAHVTEALEEKAHAVDVGFVIASFEERRLGDGEIAVRFLELEPRASITERHPKQLLVLAILLVVSRCRVSHEMIDRLVLRFRPPSFAAYVGADARLDF